MSDDFDREAERERLREKYERDKAKREASERMSELLLQGATMTNRHCPECNAPIFRYDGTEFCPTCERQIVHEDQVDDGGQSTEQAGEEGIGAGDEPPAATNGEVGASAEGAGDSRPADAGATGDDEAIETDAQTDGRHPTEDPESTGPSGHEPDDGSEDEGEDEDEYGDEGVSSERESVTPRQGADDVHDTGRERAPARVDLPARAEVDAGDLGEAEAALLREITALARRAEETRDVGRKRDLFAATREAAEAMQAIRRL